MELDLLVSNTQSLKTELTNSDVSDVVDRQVVKNLTCRLFQLAHGWDPTEDDSLLQEAHRRGFKLEPFLKADW